MDVVDYCNQILFSANLAAKINFPKNLSFTDCYNGNNSKVTEPARSQQIAFCVKQVKFPKKNSLNQNDKKAVAFNAFANHELLAIEIMAYTIRYLPHHNSEDIKFKRAILSTIKDEQKHFKLYQKRMEQLGYNFGDFALNNFFWKQVPSIKNKETYLALIALTFESANLDFASYYRDLFLEMEDFDSAAVMNEVYQDEISHVALGGHYFNKWREDKSLWDYYQENLPWPMTPARSKGIVFNSDSRLKANLGNDFMNNLKNYQDDFKITNRKTWKS